jgi:hypothetical protein
MLRVEGLSGTDHIIPPTRIFVARMKTGGMGVSCQCMVDEYGVRLFTVELPIRLIGEGNGAELFAALQFEFRR